MPRVGVRMCYWNMEHMGVGWRLEQVRRCTAKTLAMGRKVLYGAHTDSE